MHLGYFVIGFVLGATIIGWWFIHQWIKVLKKERERRKQFLEARKALYKKHTASVTRDYSKSVPSPYFHRHQK